MRKYLVLGVWVIGFFFFGIPNGLSYASFSEGTSIISDFNDSTIFFQVDTCEYEVDTGGEICCNSSGCGPGYDPGLIFEVSPPTGGTGNYVYMWLISELMFDPSGNAYWTPAKPLLNPDGSLYDGRELAPGPLDVSTRFRRCVSTRECIEAGFNFFIETNVVTITVLDCNCRPKNGGEIAPDQATCEDSLNPDTLVSIRNAVPADLNDPIVYQWYFNFSNTIFDPSVWVPISGANDAFYDPPLTDRDIYYIRVAFNPQCRTEYVLSNVVFINVGTDLNVIERIINPKCHDTEDGKIRLEVLTPFRPFVIQWDHTTSGSDTLCDLAPGDYAYRVINAKGCEQMGVSQVLAPDSIMIAAEVEGNACEGLNNGSIDLMVSGGTGSYRFLWNTNDRTEDLDSLSEGTYCVTVTDANACENQACFEIESKSTLIISSEVIDVACFGENDGRINLTITGGMSPYDFIWEDSTTTQNRDNLGTGIYCVTVMDAKGCTADRCFEIFEPDSLYVIAVVTSVRCQGGCDGAINPTVIGGTPPFSVLWNDGAVSEDRDGLKPGTFCCIVTDANGCEVEDCFVIEDGDSVVVDLPDTLYKCPGNTPIFLNPDGNPDYEYSWTPGDLVSDSTAINPETFPERDTCISVTVTDPISGCSTEVKIVVLVGEFPDFDLPDVITACDSVVEVCIDSYPDLDLDWSCDRGFVDIIGSDTCIQVPVFEKDIIYFRATDSFECVFMDSIKIENHIIDISYVDSIRFCEGDTIIFEIADINGTIDTWTFDCLEDLIVEEEDGRLTLTYDRDTTFQCSFTVSNQFCSEQYSFIVEVFENDHTVSASADPTSVNKGLKTELRADSPNSNDRYLWSPDRYLLDPVNSKFPMAMPEESIVYTVISEDERGCTAMDSVRIDYTCICDEPYIFMPNAFTPNGDNLNDTYNVVSEESLVEDMYLAVYDRWGNLVFETRSLNVDWDGTYNGQLVNPDVYAYYVRVKCVGNEEEFNKRGNVTVLY